MVLATFCAGHFLCVYLLLTSLPIDQAPLSARCILLMNAAASVCHVDGKHVILLVWGSCGHSNRGRWNGSRLSVSPAQAHFPPPPILHLSSLDLFPYLAPDTLTSLTSLTSSHPTTYPHLDTSWRPLTQWFYVSLTTLPLPTPSPPLLCHCVTLTSTPSHPPSPSPRPAISLWCSGLQWQGQSDVRS